MAFNELLYILKYLTSACVRLTTLEEKCGVDTFDQWERCCDSWNIVNDFIRAHPELP